MEEESKKVSEDQEPPQTDDPVEQEKKPPMLTTLSKIRSATARNINLTFEQRPTSNQTFDSTDQPITPLQKSARPGFEEAAFFEDWEMPAMATNVSSDKKI